MRFNFEKVLSLCAIFIALGATIVTYYQTELLKKHQEISVWPHLLLYQNGQARLDDQPMPFNLHLQNQGMGPALIKKISYFYQDIEVESFLDALKRLHQDAYGTKSSWVYSDKDTFQVILPGKEILLLGTTSKNVVDDQLLKGFWTSARIEVCYCSLYEQCWLLQVNKDEQQRKAVPLKTCDTKVLNPQSAF